MKERVLGLGTIGSHDDTSAFVASCFMNRWPWYALRIHNLREFVLTHVILATGACGGEALSST